MQCVCDHSFQADCYKNREAAYAFRVYLDPPSNRDYDPPFPTTARSGDWDKAALTVIELGSGAGMVASTLAPLLSEGDLLVVTDLAEVGGSTKDLPRLKHSR